MDLRQFERIERPPVRISDPRSTPNPASNGAAMPSPPGRLGAPGIRWLIGWVPLFWFALVLVVFPRVLIYQLVAPESGSLRGFPGTEEWLRSSLAWIFRWSATVGTAAAIEGFLVGSALWLMVRSRLRRAAWLPFLCLVGLGAGAVIGYLLLVLLSFSEGGSLYVSNPDLFYLRHVVIVAVFGGTGSALAMALVLQPQLPGYGWWAAAWVVALTLGEIAAPLVIVLGASTAQIGMAAAFVGFPGFAIITGVATFYALRGLPRVDGRTDQAVPSVTPTSDSRFSA
jgi:hypothetical protein